MYDFRQIDEVGKHEERMIDKPFSSFAEIYLSLNTA